MADDYYDTSRAILDDTPYRTLLRALQRNTDCSSTMSAVIDAELKREV